MATLEALLAAPYDNFASQDSAGGAAQVIDIAAPSDTQVRHIVQFFSVSFSAAPTAGEIQIIEDPAGGNVVKYRVQVPATLQDEITVNLKGLKIAKGKVVRLSIPAGGGAVVSSGNLGVMTRFDAQ